MKAGNEEAGSLDGNGKIPAPLQDTLLLLQSQPQILDYLKNQAKNEGVSDDGSSYAKIIQRLKSHLDNISGVRSALK